MFNAGVRRFGMVKRADFLVFLGRDSLRKMVGVKVVIGLVIEMVVLESGGGRQWCGDECGSWWCRQ